MEKKTECQFAVYREFSFSISTIANTYENRRSCLNFQENSYCIKDMLKAEPENLDEILLKCLPDRKEFFL